MTWGEFKKAVEAQGVTDDTELAWVDVSGDSVQVKPSTYDRFAISD